MFKKVKILLFNIFQNLLKILPPKYSCTLSNIRQTVMGRNIRFSYKKELDLFKVQSDNLTMYFNEKMRGLNTYSYGIKERALSLAETYSLNLVEFSDNDVIIDCGANYGDLYAWTLVNKIKLNYISFEPSPIEFKCIQLNCEGQQNNNIALSDSKGQFYFYVKSATGDSSLIEPAGGYEKKINTKTITLDSYLENYKIQEIKFFKLEAEGFEPEILQGSINSIKKIKYIGVDGSPERGKNKEWTIDFAKNFLIKNGFDLISLKSNNFFAKALFKNKN